MPANVKTRPERTLLSKKDVCSGAAGSAVLLGKASPAVEVTNSVKVGAGGGGVNVGAAATEVEDFLLLLELDVDDEVEEEELVDDTELELEVLCHKNFRHRFQVSITMTTYDDESEVGELDALLSPCALSGKCSLKDSEKENVLGRA